jgi:hypothetical protein
LGSVVEHSSGKRGHKKWEPMFSAMEDKNRLPTLMEHLVNRKGSTAGASLGTNMFGLGWKRTDRCRQQPGQSSVIWGPVGGAVGAW